MASSCYACETTSTSREHVPPKCLFPELDDSLDAKDYRVNLLTVRSCDQHNGEKSGEDIYFVALITACIDNNGIAVNHFWTKIKRSLESDNRLMGVILSMVKPIEYKGIRTLGVQIDDATRARIGNYIKLMARGIYLKKFKSKWLQELKIVTNALKKVDESLDAPIAFFFALCDEFFEHENIPYLGSNPEVFKYRFVTAPDKSAIFLDILFFDGVRFLVTDSALVTSQL